MSAIDVYAAVCVLVVGWTGYRLGVATERDRVRERRQLAADIAAARGVVDLNTRRSAS